MNNFNKEHVVYLVVGLIIAIAVVFAFTSTQNAEVDKQTNAIVKVEKSNVEWLKSSLNLYYLDRGRYPATMESYRDYLKENETDEDKAKSLAIYDSLEEKLSGFDYSVRGDGQSYKITYTSETGKAETVTGNYKEDYN